MKLSKENIEQLDSLVHTALIAGIKKIIINEGVIRGIDEKQTTVIISESNVPDMFGKDGKQIGINRIDQLAARLNLLKNQGEINIDATLATNQADVMMLDLSAGKTKAQFRCASIEAVKGVPKTIVGETKAWEFNIKPTLIPTLTQAISAMGSETVTIASKDGQTVSFECVDANKDVFTTDSDEPPVYVGLNDVSSFCQKYPAKTFLILIKEGLKNLESLKLSIGENKVLTLKVNGFDFSLLPAQ
jgi:hypothetical protein